MSIFKGLIARGLTATSSLTLKNMQKNYLLHQASSSGLRGNSPTLKITTKNSTHVLRHKWIFFHDKKKFKCGKIFQTCTMSIRLIVFHDFFFVKNIPVQVHQTYTEFYPTLKNLPMLKQAVLLLP